MAYSTKINDPAYSRYLKNTRNYRLLFSILLAIAAISGFFLYGHFSDEMDNSEAVYIGLVIGGMFIFIGFFSILPFKPKKSWDGVVTGKDIREEKGKLVYVVFISDEENKVHEITSDDDRTLYDYYNEGERLRYHGRLLSYEKFDKSQDEIIFCNACAFMHEISDDFCRNCGCPLLK